MSINVVRTDQGWFVEQQGSLTPVATKATTTAELLADRVAVEKAAAKPATGGPRLEELTVLSPVTRGRVVAQMLNYRSHAEESGVDPDKVLAAFFRKASGSVSSATDDIVCPPHVRLLDYEIELGVVLGAPLAVGTTVTSETLGDYVAALVITNDVSARDVQLVKTQFYESKSYPTFTPVGPFLTLVTAEELAALGQLRMTLSVNGEVRQDASLDDMIIEPAAALTALARFQELAPGDLVLTGTPGGTALKAPPHVVEVIAAMLPTALKWKLFFDGQAKNPRYLKDGDVVAATITNPSTGLDLGQQCNLVRKPGA